MGLIATQLKPRCALYARVSPKPEGAAGDNFSIASQLHEMRALALKKYGCDSPDEYIDRNKSGSTLERPELDRLRDNLGLKLYDVVIAYSPDRWTRGGDMDSAILDQELAKGGAKLDFCSGSYEDTPEGHLSRDVQNSVSKYERAKFRERSRRCRRQKSRDGFPHACHPPDGYKYEGHKFGKKGEYVIVPERAKIIKVIFIKTAEGMTNAQMARWLNREGIKTQKGYRWAAKSVAQVLKKTKTAYYGEITQNGEKIKVPAIVSRELWDRAHEALARNKVGAVGREPREYLLSGRLWCARCKHRCGTANHAAYRCNHVDHVDRSVRFCHAPEIRKSIIEPVIWNALWDAICDPGLLWQLVEAYHDRVSGRPAKTDPAIVRIDRARRLVARQEQILGDPDQPVPYPQAKAQLEAARRELAEAQLSAGAAVTIMPLRKDVDAASAHFRAMRDELVTFKRRREALKLLVSKIYYADGKAEIHANLPAPAERTATNSKSNCHRRISGNGNYSSPIPFVINCSITSPPPAERSKRGARGRWQKRVA